MMLENNISPYLKTYKAYGFISQDRAFAHCMELKRKLVIACYVTLLLLCLCFPFKTFAAKSSHYIDKVTNILLSIETKSKNKLGIQKREDIINVTPLKGGLSGDKVYKIDTKNHNSFVIKIFRKNKLQEIRAHNTAAKHRLTAKILYKYDLPDAKTFIVMELLPNNSLLTIGQHPTQQIAKLTKFLQQLHSITPKEYTNIRTINLRRRLRKKLKFLNDHKNNIPHQNIFANLERITDIKNTLSVNTSKLVLCHNDLNPNNVFFTKDIAKAIDWGSAGINDPFYDVATVANWFFFDADHKVTLLNLYLGREATQNEIIHFQNMQSVAKFIIASNLLQTAMKMGLQSDEVAIDKKLPSLQEALTMLKNGEIKLNSKASIYRFGIVLMR